MPVWLPTKKISHVGAVWALVNWRERENGRDLMHLHDKHPKTTENASQNYIKTIQKRSITQRLRTDLGRSVRATIVIKSVWLKGLRTHLPTYGNSYATQNINKTRKLIIWQVTWQLKVKYLRRKVRYNWMNIVKDFTSLPDRVKKEHAL